MLGRNRQVVAASLILMAALVPACKRQKAPPVAAAPVTVAAAEPLSAPQITDRLPPPQPIPPEAIPPEHELPAVEPEQPQPPSKAAQRHPRVAPPASGTPAGPPPPPAALAPAPGRNAGTPQLRPMLSPAQERELRQDIDRSLTSAEQFVTRAARHASDKEAAQRVRAMIDQARQALRRGDLNLARSLAERAEVLASDLARSGR